jgi:RNA polymerase sigma factor (sigma-70 family)
MGLAEANLQLMEAKGDAKAERAALKQIHYEKWTLIRDKGKDDPFNYIGGGDIDSCISTNYRNIEGMSALVTSIAKSMASGDAELQEELESEGYVGLTLALNSWDAEEDNTSKWKTYAMTCIRNANLDYLRKNQRWDKMEYRDDIDETILGKNIPADDVLIRKEMLKEANSKLAVILADCTERERYVIFNSIMTDEPESYRTIAEQFKCSKDAVFRDLHRIMKRLREVN